MDGEGWMEEGDLAGVGVVADLGALAYGGGVARRCGGDGGGDLVLERMPGKKRCLREEKKPPTERERLVFWGGVASDRSLG